jgi:hypothetical protein
MVLGIHHKSISPANACLALAIPESPPQTDVWTFISKKVPNVRSS